jgi:hypothetical protein
VSVLLLVGVGLASVLIINSINDTANAVADINDMGFRRTLAISTSLAAKEMIDLATYGENETQLSRPKPDILSLLE